MMPQVQNNDKVYTEEACGSLPAQSSEPCEERGSAMSNATVSNGFRTSITATLSVRNWARAIDFYQAAFGARELYRVDGDGGSVVAQLSVAGAEFLVADESPGQ